MKHVVEIELFDPETRCGQTLDISKVQKPNYKNRDTCWYWLQRVAGEASRDRSTNTQIKIFTSLSGFRHFYQDVGVTLGLTLGFRNSQIGEHEERGLASWRIFDQISSWFNLLGHERISPLRLLTYPDIRPNDILWLGGESALNLDLRFEHHQNMVLIHGNTSPMAVMLAILMASYLSSSRWEKAQFREAISLKNHSYLYNLYLLWALYVHNGEILRRERSQWVGLVGGVDGYIAEAVEELVKGRADEPRSPHAAKAKRLLKGLRREITNLSENELISLLGNAPAKEPATSTPQS